MVLLFAVTAAVTLSAGVTLRTGTECRLTCDGRLVATVSCAGGVWSGEPEKGFYCYEKPQVLRSPPGPLLGSCVGQCGEGAGDCYCDTQCIKAGDCCGDYTSVCTNTVVTNTCQGRCQVHQTSPIVTRAGCQCDSECFKLGDCCQDFFTLCYPPLVTSTHTPPTQTLNNHSGNFFPSIFCN